MMTRMTRNEAVQKLSKVARISVAYAEDLYDSFFEKPVVPQYVADWYEGNKRNLDLNLCSLVLGLAMNSTDFYREELKAWAEDNKKTFITTIVNMHQFGYEVEKEPRYKVRIKGLSGKGIYLNRIVKDNEWVISDSFENDDVRVCNTRKELEDAGFGWIFSCEGIEVEEVE